LATRGLEAGILARVPVVDLWTAKRVLDQGVRGVIFPFVGDRAMAETAASSCRYPPHGRRGSGAGLAASTWFEPGVYYDTADQHMLTVCVIEEKRALDQIEEIASTPGVDVLFIGTSDLSFSLGLRGRQQDEPALDAAIERIRDAAKRNNKFLGRPAASAEDVLRFHQEGFQFFQSVTELGLMRIGAQSIMSGLGRGCCKSDESILY
jgi:2-keto-3-deoxy-L-rhamnonate aldolase RhmA